MSLFNWYYNLQGNITKWHDAAFSLGKAGSNICSPLGCQSRNSMSLSCHFQNQLWTRFYEQARGLEKAGQSPSGNMVSAWAQIPVPWGPTWWGMHTNLALWRPEQASYTFQVLKRSQRLCLQVVFVCFAFALCFSLSLFFFFFLSFFFFCEGFLFILFCGAGRLSPGPLMC